MRTYTLLEELSLNALPALRTLHLDGWILRFAGGYSKRANSVHPLYPPAGALGLEKKLGICERLYQAADLPPLFKLTEGAYPGDLDGVLAERGYQRVGPTSMQTMRLSALRPPPAADLYEAFQPTERWLDAVARIGEMGPERRQLLGELLQRIVPPSYFVGLEVDDTLVSVGYAVAKAGVVGLFQLGTAPEQRRQGYARTVTGHLLRWGKEEGARTAYLQVSCHNRGALRLYRELGFRERYKYWYRVGSVE